MNAKQRRKQILATLEEMGTPVTASALASQFDVSRQIIVGDISLLRAEGNEIRATSRGYVISYGSGFPYIGTIVVNHDAKQIECELTTIVDYGGTCIDVIVEHKIYGELTGDLNISSRYDIQLFMEKAVQQAKPLSALSEGLHMHHIGCRSKKIFELICKALREEGILIED